MGTKRDAQRRETLKRHDDASKHQKVDMARNFIYNQGRNVDSVAVERVLKPESLVPTRVSEYSSSMNGTITRLGTDFT